MDKDSDEEQYDELAIKVKASWKLCKRKEKEILKLKDQLLV